MAVLVFVVCSAVLTYVLLGYPIILSAISALARRPTPSKEDSGALPTVTLLLPVRNGERWLEAKLDSIARLDYPKPLLQVIVIDDGSTDATHAMAEEVEGVTVLSSVGHGKAAAINTGMTAATGDLLFFTDVRQKLDPPCLRRLAERFAAPEVGVVSGELVILEGESRQEADVGLYWRYEKWIRRRLSVLGVVPGATGSIYAMRRVLAGPLPAATLVDDMYLPLRAFFVGYRVEFDSAAQAFDFPTDLRAEFKRKVRTLAGNYQIIGFYPRLLLPTHRMWLHFVSHKLGRLLLPFALLGIAVSTMWLPAPWMLAPLVIQAVVYGSAAIDPLIPEASPWKQVSSPARTFVVLMAAAAAAASYLLPGTRQYWKPTEVRPAKPPQGTAAPS